MNKRLALYKKLNYGFQFTEVFVNPRNRILPTVQLNDILLHILGAIKVGDSMLGVKSLKELTKNVKDPHSKYYNLERIQNLPRISFPGVVKEGGYIIESIGLTNLMALELERAGNDDWTMEQIRDFGFVIAYFTNVEEGLTLIVRADYSTGDEYLETFREITRFLMEELGKAVNLRGEDIAYANIINYDPSAYINWGAVPFQAWLRHF